MMSLFGTAPGVLNWNTWRRTQPLLISLVPPVPLSVSPRGSLKFNLNFSTNNHHHHNTWLMKGRRCECLLSCGVSVTVQGRPTRGQCWLSDCCSITSHLTFKHVYNNWLHKWHHPFTAHLINWVLLYNELKHTGNRALTANLQYSYFAMTWMTENLHQHVVT